MTILCPLLQISEEFHDICQTETRLMDEWLRYKPRIPQLAAIKPALQHLVENLDDVDEG